MADHISRPTALERLGAEIAKGNLGLPFEFRDESERLEFRIEMAHVDIRANLWKMLEQLKVLEKFMDRR